VRKLRILILILLGLKLPRPLSYKQKERNVQAQYCNPLHKMRQVLWCMAEGGGELERLHLRPADMNRQAQNKTHSFVPLSPLHSHSLTRHSSQPASFFFQTFAFGQRKVL
jgi:hypothetical protein